jgi:hypothetical protein
LILSIASVVLCFFYSFVLAYSPAPVREPVAPIAPPAPTASDRKVPASTQFAVADQNLQTNPASREEIQSAIDEARRQQQSEKPADNNPRLRLGKEKQGFVFLPAHLFRAAY